MKNPIQLNTAIRDFFEHHAKVALQKTEKPQDLAGFEKQAEALRCQVGQLDTPFRVAVLGQARVGKSTLINALVAGTASVVPSGGGDGPLTANVLRVCYGSEKRFTVRYHPRRKINEMLFGLERKLERQNGQRAAELEAANLQLEDEEAIKWASDLELTPAESKEP